MLETVDYKLIINLICQRAATNHQRIIASLKVTQETKHGKKHMFKNGANMVTFVMLLNK